MNWYFEVQGVSKGPFPEGEFAQMVRQRDVPTDSLVWKPGLDEWATLAELSPPWLADVAAVEPEPRKQKALASSKKTSLPKDALTHESPLVIEGAIPSEPAAPVRAPEPSKLKLQAPTPAAEPSHDPAEKSGLLKRVFGFGGKKKG